MTRIPKIASAIAVAPAELFVPKGSAFVSTVFVGGESLERIRREGRPAVEEIAAVISGRLTPSLARARPLLDNVPVGMDVRQSTGRRRGREEVLALERKRLERLRRAARKEPDRLEAMY